MEELTCGAADIEYLPHCKLFTCRRHHHSLLTSLLSYREPAVSHAADVSL